MTVDDYPILRELTRPEAYSASVPEVGFLQTHISLLFFAGERVYKVKKPVDLGFLDFTTLERRRRCCEDEVRLNRRLAPDVYLGTVPIVRTRDGHLRVGGEGEAVEWAVEMVRLPEGRMFSNLLERGEIDNEQMNAIAALLARFHATCPTGPEVDEHGAPEAIRANVDQNFEQLAPHVGRPGPAAGSRPGLISEVQHAFLEGRSRRFMARHADLLERRVRTGRIREGHGDLHAGNICLPDGEVVAYDCIEFSQRLRCGDVAADIAFLAMDLDQRGFPAFSSYLVKRYAEEARDPELRALIGFYKGYRAIVRGKVAAMTLDSPGLDADRVEELRRQSMSYLQLALGYELPPALVLMCGLPACGKSWAAKALARPLRATLLRSDVRRKVRSGLEPTARARSAYDSGLYTPERTRETYRSLLEGAVDTLGAGRSVVVDATFARRAYRAPFVDAATRLGLPFYVLHVSATEQTVFARLARRALDPREASDADREVYLRARELFEPPTEVPRGHVVELESGQEPAERQNSLALDRMIELAGGEWDDPGPRAMA